MTRLGGVPISVPVPPIFAAYAIASIIIFLCFAPNSTKTASSIGIIMAVLAVLLIHIDRIAVGSMNPRRTMRGELPTNKSTLKPTLLNNYKAITTTTTGLSPV